MSSPASSTPSERPGALPIEDLWTKALAKFKDLGYTSIQNGTGDRRKIVEDILSVVRNSEQNCQQNRWRWKNRKGDIVIIRDLFAKMAVWIEKFKGTRNYEAFLDRPLITIGIGDTITQYDPAHAALPWAAARFLLQCAINDIQNNAAVVEGLELVFNLVAKFEVVERLYLQRKSTLQSKLRQAIIALYTSILTFLFEASRYYTQNTASRIVKSVFQVEEMAAKFLTNIKAKALEVDEFVKLFSGEIMESTEKKLDGATEALKVLSLQFSKIDDIQSGTERLPLVISKQTKDLENLLVTLSQPIYRLASHISLVDDHLKEEERLKIFCWLSECPYSGNHRNKTKILMPGSGQWLHQKPQFREWMDSSTSSILWLHGIPGSGKSMLVAHVIEYFQSLRIESNLSAPLAYFYCARNAHEPERSDPTEIMSSILEQLSCTGEEEPIKNPVVAAYKARKREARGRKPERLGLDDCTELILELLDTDPAVIILDGLDECDPKRRHDFLDALRTIIKDANNICKVFVSSRDDHDLVHRLSETPNLYIQASDNGGDISRFVVSRVDEAIAKQRILCGQVSTSLRKNIILTLLQKANGMFRLPSLHIDTLCDPNRIKTEANVLYALSHLPPDLASSYDAVLDQISQSQPPNPQIAQRFMRMIICMRITSGAFLAGASVGFDELGPMTVANILSISCNMVVLDEYSNTFRFAHLSVQEHLQTLDDYSLERSNATAAEICLSWIFRHVNFAFPGSERDSIIPRDSPGTAYSADSMRIMSQVGVQSFESFSLHADKFALGYAHYARNERKQGVLQTLLRDLLIYNTGNDQQNSVSVFNAWMKNRPSLEVGISYPAHPIFIAAKYNLSEIVDEIIKISPSALTLKSNMKKECSQLASMWNSLETLKIILKHSRRLDRYNEILRDCINAAATTGSGETLAYVLFVAGKGFVQKEDMCALVMDMRNSGHTSTEDILQLLFDNNQDLEITEEIWEATFKNRFDVNSIMVSLLNRATEITLTHRLLQAMRDCETSRFDLIGATILYSNIVINCPLKILREMMLSKDGVSMGFLKQINRLTFFDFPVMETMKSKIYIMDLPIELEFVVILARQQEKFEISWEDLRKLKFLPKSHE